MRNTVFTAFLHHIDSSYSFCAVLLDNFAPYSLLMHCLCGAACLFSTVQAPHTLPMRCYLIFLHRTASSCTAYAVPLANFTPYRLLIHCLCGAACHFSTVQAPHTLSIRCCLLFLPHCEAVSPARTKKHTQFFAKLCIQASPHSIHIKLRTAEAPRGPRLLSLYYLE